MTKQPAYPDGVMFPVFSCCGCGQWLQLPYRRFLNSSLIEPYWPDGDPALPWVCDACGRYESCTHLDLQWIPEANLVPLSASRGFWRVEVPCGMPSCHLSVVAHIQTFGKTSQRNLGLMLAHASPIPICELGHAIRAESSYPERIDFVEWAGRDEYLT